MWQRLRNYFRSEDSSEKLAARIALAQGRLLEDESLTADLMDPEAQALIDWAVGRIARLVEVTRDLDDTAAWAALEPQLRELRQQLRRVARLSAGEPAPLQTLQAMLAALDAPEGESNHEA